ncbi:Hypothetical_protein [Hexamita inflata]|uniref:Hypothetical_protein n=1 Tax=Hexamita inflata TaxID=28002 RepID=A0ABP1I704_9EUKA
MKFIPTDNMCQVLNGKSSSAIFLLQSPLNGKVQVPSSGTGIPFTYLYNQNIIISYQFSSLALYDQILDAQFGAFKILLDGEYEVEGSVADVFHTLSNQTACFSSARFTYSLIDNWFSFEVEPLFCNVASFTVFFEYYSDNKWLRIPVHEIDDSNVFVKPDDYKTSNTQFLSIKRYLLDVSSASESSKYSDTDRSALANLISTVTQNISTPIRLSLDYFVKSTTASITAIAEYKFSDNSMGCFSAMTPKTTIPTYLPSFSVFFEYYSNNKWLRIPVYPVEDTNQFSSAIDYRTSNQQFLQIRRYLLDLSSADEFRKYSPSDLVAINDLVQTAMSNISTPIRLSLDYQVKSITASITTIAEYKFSDNAMNCLQAMMLKASVNENGLLFKTGFMNSISCLEVNNLDPRYHMAQFVKQNAAFVQVSVLITTVTHTSVELLKLVSFESFLSLYLVEFNENENENIKRQLIDSDEFQDAKIQLFVIIIDSNAQLLLDFSSKPIELERTCVDKRVLHIYKSYLEVVVWVKQLERCKLRPTLTTNINIVGLQLKNANYEIVEQYAVTHIVNFSRNTDIIPITCDNSLGEKQDCLFNITCNMKTHIRDQIVYFVESTSELSQIQYKVMETSNGVWKHSYILFGASLFVLICCLLYHLLKDKQKQ